MGKRPTQKPGNTEGENGAGKPAGTPSQSSDLAGQAGGDAGAGGDTTSGALNTQGANDAGNTAEALLQAPGDPQGSAPGQGGEAQILPATDTTRVQRFDIAEAVTNAIARGNEGTDSQSSAHDLGNVLSPAAAASGAGGHPGDADRAALEDAVRAIGDNMHPIIPEGMTLGGVTSRYQVQVTGPKRGRRRLGRDFGREPVSIPIEALTDADLAALHADPALTVEVIKVEIPGRETGGQPGETGAPGES